MPPTASETADRLDCVFHALSDRTRRALLDRLGSGPAMVTELARPFSISLPAVSKHLRVLEKAGLVERAVSGRVHRCSFGAEPLREIERWLDDRRMFWDGALAALADYVEGGDDLRHGGRRQR